MRKDETLLKKKFMDEAKTWPNTWLVKIQQAAITGTPDIVMCIRGKFVAVELKSKTGKVSPLQMYNMDKITEANGIALVVEPENVDKCIAGLKAFANGEPPPNRE